MNTIDTPVVFRQANTTHISRWARTAATTLASSEQCGNLILAEQADEVLDPVFEREARVAERKVVRFSYPQRKQQLSVLRGGANRTGYLEGKLGWSL